MSTIFRSAAGLLLAAALAACVEAPPRPEGEADLAVRGLSAEEHDLDAVQALIAGNRPDEALEALESGDWTDASAAQRRKRAALRAELVLARGDARQALALLTEPLLREASPSIARSMRQTRAAAFLSIGRPLDAAREGTALEELGLDPAAAEANRRFIWSALAQVTPAGLDAARIPPPSRLGGWIELATLYRAFRFDHASFEKALEVWKSRFPGHSAGPEMTAELLAIARPPAKVALLLPASGAFAGAARAVRDGFLSAWYLVGSPENRPALIIRDTSDADVGALLAGVADEGAEFVVGPLRKSSVREAARLGRPALPVLALNRIADEDDLPPARDFYQFALSPEEEAYEVAKRARRDGYARAGVLVPEGEWGTRVARAFSTAWESLGGRIVETRPYSTGGEEDSQPPDLSAPVELFLNIDESTERRDLLRKTLGRRVHFEPRRRTDVDVVFLAGFPRELRQLRPQFEFHKAGSVPIYSTSHVYTGVPDPESDGDVDDIVFGDMPMVLPATRDGTRLRRRLSALWPERLRAYPRLYAFGADAFALVTRLRHLEESPHNFHEGYTGRLRLDERGRVHRSLRWVRFESGLPRPLDPRPDPL